MKFNNSAWKEIEKTNNLYKKIMNYTAMELMEKSYQKQTVSPKIAENLMNPPWQSAFSQTDKILRTASHAEAFKGVEIIDSVFTAVKPLVVERLYGCTKLFSEACSAEKMLASANVLKSYISIVTRIMKSPVTDALKTLTETDYDSLKMCGIRIGDIDICEDTFVIDGERCTVEEMQDSIVEVGDGLSAGDDIKSLCEKAEKKIAVFLAFLEMITMVYSTVEVIRGINEHVIIPVCREMQGLADVEYVKVERAYIKEEPNYNSKNICEVLYAERVEVIDEVKFWRKVSYHTDNQEIVGWISKISIGTEEDIGE